mgnify:CR=1 FL=1
MSKSKRLLAHLFALNTAMGGAYGESFEDIIYMSRDHIRDISMSLILEIRQLEEEGYTYEEIETIRKRKHNIYRFTRWWKSIS